jgi:hypothetical protein
LRAKAAAIIVSRHIFFFFISVVLKNNTRHAADRIFGTHAVHRSWGDPGTPQGQCHVPQPNTRRTDNLINNTIIWLGPRGVIHWALGDWGISEIGELKRGTRLGWWHVAALRARPFRMTAAQEQRRRWRGEQRGQKRRSSISLTLERPRSEPLRSNGRRLWRRQLERRRFRCHRLCPAQPHTRKVSRTRRNGGGAL